MWIGLALTLWASFVTYQRHGRYLNMPEEALMFDYSILQGCIRAHDQLWEALACPEQVTLLFPWGLLSEASNFMHLDVVWEFRLVFLLRLLLAALSLYCLFAIVAKPLAAVMMAVSIFNIHYFIGAMYYGHQWANIVLFSGLLAYMLRQQRGIKHSVVEVGVILAISISVFTNVAHLMTAWLAIPIGAIFVVRGSSWTAVRHKLFPVALATPICYAGPILLYVQRIPYWSELDLSQIQRFGNGSIGLVLQGFGAWWHSSLVSIAGSPLLPYLDMDQYLSFQRQYVRILLLLVIIGTWIFLRAQLSNDLTRFASTRFFGFFVGVAGLLALLSASGSSSVYQMLWLKSPEFFKLIREPWQKFIPLYSIIVYMLVAACLTYWLSQIQTRFRWITYVPLVVVALWLSSPALRLTPSTQLDTLRLHARTVAEWRQLDRDLMALSSSARNICILQREGFDSVVGLAELRLWKQLDDTPRLRTLSINDAMAQIGRGRPDCATSGGVTSFLIPQPSTLVPVQLTQSGGIDSFEDSGCQLTQYQSFLLVSECWSSLSQIEIISDSAATLTIRTFGAGSSSISAPDTISHLKAEDVVIFRLYSTSEVDRKWTFSIIGVQHEDELNIQIIESDDSISSTFRNDSGLFEISVNTRPNSVTEFIVTPLCERRICGTLQEVRVSPVENL
jgi:hypothetical protein